MIFSAAVVDENERLVGVLTMTMWSTSSSRRLRGITAHARVGDEELSDTVAATPRSRVPTATGDLGTAFISATVISMFGAMIE
jgi:magnesium transporter